MKIIQMTFDDKFVMEYDSLGDVGKLGFDYFKVRHAVNRNMMAQGYKWKQVKSTKDIYEYNDRYYKPIPHGIRIQQLTRYGTHIRYWNSIEAATINLDLPEGGIQNVLDGNAKTSGGYQWKIV